MTGIFTSRITEDDCYALTQKIKELKQINAFFKDKLRLSKIAEATQIPIGSLGFAICYDKLTTARYRVVKLYVDDLIEKNNKFIETPRHE